jgi:transglutaminase-like putative cysteine protease
MSAPATAPPRPAAPAGRSAPATPPAEHSAPTAAVNTIITAAGCALGILPVGSLFTDNRWYLESVGAIILVAGPAALLRLRQAPRAIQLLPGLILLFFYVFGLYLHKGAFAGLVPGSGTGKQLHDLQRQTRDIITNGTTPLKSTAGLRLYVVSSVGVLAALTDWLANVRRSPALAGVGFLATFTIVGAVRGTSVGWWQFAFAAVGYLLVLATASRRETAEWGRLVPRVGQSRDTPLQLSASGARIGTIAVVLALVTPLFVPGLGRNLLLDTFHNGPGNGRADESVSAFADLAGQLRNSQTVKWYTVHVQGNSSAPFYLRQQVLTVFTAGGWREGLAGDLVLPRPNVLTAALNAKPSSDYTATIKMLGYKGPAPIFAQPTGFDRLRDDWQFDTTKETLTDSITRTNETYTESVAEPAPTIDELRASPPAEGPQEGVNDVPAEVRSIVQRTVAGEKSPYDKALALAAYFSPSNGFVYDTKTKTGDTGNALLDFLHNKAGFCQQYAAALGIMLRIAGIPARVVIGTTHRKLDAAGNVTVTNHDAHAWVEANFQGIGWIPFDPTPLSGADAGRAVDLPWGPDVNAGGPSSSSSASEQVPSKPNTDTGQPSNSGGASAGSNSGHSGLRLPLGVLVFAMAVAVALVLLSIRPGLRQRQRGQRYRQARQEHRLGPVWHELRAVAVDAGVPWPVQTTPRQVPGWLAKYGAGATQPEITRLAVGAEREFYADPASTPPQDDRDITEAIDSVRRSRHDLMTQMPRSRRWWMRIWPASMSRRPRWFRRRQH